MDTTAEILRREGYECDCVSDAKLAAEMLREKEYDVFISDIDMPGNPELELIKDVPSIVDGLPVILVTGHPSVSTAISSIQLPVDAYLVKPFEFEELLEQVISSIARYRTYRVVCSTRQRLGEWQRSIDDIENVMKRDSTEGSPVPINTFFALTLQNIVEALMDLKNLTEKLTMQADEQFACNLLNCSRLDSLKKGLRESANILKKTKGAFKSKELGDLRKRIEVLIEDV